MKKITTDETVKIIAIGKSDAFYSARHSLVGCIGKFSQNNWFDGNYPGGFRSGDFVNDEHNIYFARVKIRRLE